MSTGEKDCEGGGGGRGAKDDDVSRRAFVEPKEGPSVAGGRDSGRRKMLGRGGILGRRVRAIY